MPRPELEIHLDLWIADISLAQARHDRPLRPREPARRHRSDQRGVNLAGGGDRTAGQSVMAEHHGAKPVARIQPVWFLGAEGERDRHASRQRDSRQDNNKKEAI
jgi:hypothetical protein